MNVNDPYFSLIISAQRCPYCDNKPSLIDSKKIYSKDFGKIWYCYSCNAYVGCHKRTNISLGSVAQKPLRDLRKTAHKYFDHLCLLKAKKEKIGYNKARSLGYKWLSEELNIPLEFTHIGMFDEQDCKKVIKLCLPYIKKNNDRTI